MREYIFPDGLTYMFESQKDGYSTFELMKKIVDDYPDTYYMKWDNILILLIERGMEEYYPEIDSFMNPCYGEYIKEK